MKLRCPLLVAALAVAATLSLQASSIIISQPGLVDANLNKSGGTLGGTVEQILQVRWRQTDSYSDVSITAEIGNRNFPLSTVTAYLTTATGPSETIADQVATTTFHPTSNDYDAPVFSGLNLAPGNYYLTMVGGTDSVSFAEWFDAPIPVYNHLTLDAGVQFLGDWVVDGPPFNRGILDTANLNASTFDRAGNGFAFTVTGLSEEEAAGVPEPASMILLGSGLAAMIARRRLRVN